VGVREVLKACAVPEPFASAIERLTSLAGDKAVLEEAARVFAFCAPARMAVEELHQTVRTLEDAGLGQHVTIDLGEVRGLDYYTGLVFRAYAPGLGFEVGGGGRYDALLARFGRPMPAVGFMLGLDRVALLLDRQGTGKPTPARIVEQLNASGDPGRDLLRARQRREEGVRVRLGNGGLPSEGSR
jgi:ATP phosphoribosyltransferase regulatory subunit